jgi:CheY-like chemotaxis protein
VATILIVDDALDSAEMLAWLFRRTGYETRVAGDGLQALDALETGPPVDLVILDLNMPEMDGIGFLRAMRDSATPTPPVVLLTASCDPEAIAEATRLGARRYFLKADFKLKDLREYVAQQVEH